MGYLVWYRLRKTPTLQIIPGITCPAAQEGSVRVAKKGRAPHAPSGGQASTSRTDLELASAATRCCARASSRVVKSAWAHVDLQLGVLWMFLRDELRRCEEGVAKDQLRCKT